LLPLSLQDRIQSLLKTSELKSSLITAREKLTMRYREKNGGGFASSSEALAYVAARLPATFAAMQAVLPQVPLQDISTILDLGAGPGTAALAAGLQWPEAERVHLVERDGFMSEVSQKLLQDLPETNHQTLTFQCANLLTHSLQTRFDLILLSYVLNELSPEDQTDVLKKAWSATEKGLVIVVPGTPLAYKQLMDLRDLLIAEGAFIAAPCPHHDACPLKEGDWCHFSTRLSRPAFHREIKKVSLPYEDEKYSFLVALRDPVARAQARIIRKPILRSGHVTLDLCTHNGLKRQTVSKKDKALYKQATKVVWGNSWKG
jgi:ribosomal protein RSM22 (predicted rRNA methylase)